MNFSSEQLEGIESETHEDKMEFRVQTNNRSFDTIDLAFIPSKINYFGLLGETKIEMGTLYKHYDEMVIEGCWWEECSRG